MENLTSGRCPKCGSRFNQVGDNLNCDNIECRWSQPAPTAKEPPSFVKEYQCIGCVSGGNCFEKDPYSESCDKHCAGTLATGIGSFFLGLPKGFCRKGESPLKVQIFKTFSDLQKSWAYDKFNVPVWKHLNAQGHTLVRGLSPRVNTPFLHIVLENCISQIDCLEITSKDIEEMD